MAVLRKKRPKATPIMAITTRQYEAKDFAQLHKLDQECFPPGIAYSKWSLHYYLSLPGADCLVTEEGKQLAGFILAEDHPPLGHIITLDVAEKFRKRGVGTMLLQEMEEHFVFRGVESVLLETSVENKSGIAFWEKHGYRTEAVVKKYYLGKIDAFEMRKKLEIRK
jgi:[ribosomal protein S18]-alanine N-acetyltransferase